MPVQKVSAEEILGTEQRISLLSHEVELFRRNKRDRQVRPLHREKQHGRAD